MKSEEIAKEITLKALNHDSKKSLITNDSETNKSLANEVSKFYKKIYKTAEECINTPAKDIKID